MTATIDLLDEFLSDVRHLSLIDADKVRDFLLDLRLLLAVPSCDMVDHLHYSIEFEAEA